MYCGLNRWAYFLEREKHLCNNFTQNGGGLPIFGKITVLRQPRSQAFPACEWKSKGKGREPCKIYHVRNVIGRENIITHGQTSELAHALRTKHTRESFMADRTGLGGTMLHYQAVRQAMVSVHRPVHSKIMLTYLDRLPWQTDCCTSWLSRRY